MGGVGGIGRGGRRKEKNEEDAAKHTSSSFLATYLQLYPILIKHVPIRFPTSPGPIIYTCLVVHTCSWEGIVNIKVNIKNIK